MKGSFVYWVVLYNFLSITKKISVRLPRDMILCAKDTLVNEDQCYFNYFIILNFIFSELIGSFLKLIF